MHRLIPVLLGLAACSAPAPEVAGFRAAGTPIYSNAVFRPDRLGGHWVQVADFAPPQTVPCAAAGFSVVPRDASRLGVQADLCLGGRRQGFDGVAEVTGPGRMTLTGADPAGIGAEWWVLWVDDGYRTMVIGTPSGRFGMIVDRGGDPPQDRLAAAREILAWNGYDLAQLRRVSRR